VCNKGSKWNDAFLGQVRLNGVKLALEEIKEKGCINGRLIKLIETDDGNVTYKSGNICLKFTYNLHTGFLKSDLINHKIL